MRRTTEQLWQEGNDGPARAVDFVAERAERLGSYLTGATLIRFSAMSRDSRDASPGWWLSAEQRPGSSRHAWKASSSARQAGSAATRSRQTWQPEASPSIGSGAIPATTVQEMSEQPVLTAPRGSNG